MNNKITMLKPLYIGTTDVGTTLTNHGTAISTIQGNISTINTEIYPI